MPECVYCGDELSDEEAENPYRDGEGDDDVMCDQCHHEHYEFTCYWCGDYWDNSERDRFLVVSVECGALMPGVYRITRFPYYWNNLLSMGWYPEAFECVAPVPPEVASNANCLGTYASAYPSGHLCRGCIERIETVEAMMNGAA